MEFVLCEVRTELLYICYMFHELFTMMQLKTSLCDVLSKMGRRGAGQSHLHMCITLCIVRHVLALASTYRQTLQKYLQTERLKLTFEVTEISASQLILCY